mmetsp:Transcript_62091/g.161337  ORF Transcript_62091/g.161337 Transcript_62091/m.161337 type:complete len:217 (+) Transcript_62091:999-1649(+)
MQLLLQAFHLQPQGLQLGPPLGQLAHLARAGQLDLGQVLLASRLGALQLAEGLRELLAFQPLGGELLLGLGRAPLRCLARRQRGRESRGGLLALRDAVREVAVGSRELAAQLLDRGRAREGHGLLGHHGPVLLGIALLGLPERGPQRLGLAAEVLGQAALLLRLGLRLRQLPPALPQQALAGAELRAEVLALLAHDADLRGCPAQLAEEGHAVLQL